MGVREGTLHLGAAEMDYIVFGRGTKPLIMIQGLNTRGIKGAGISLAWMYRIFAADYRVYLFDRRAVLPESVTIRELAADVAMAMDALHLTDAHVLGVSQGGMIAQYLAIDRPDLVGRMVLAVTASKTNETVSAAIGAWISMTEQGAVRELVEDMAVRMYSDGYIRRYRPFLPLLALLQKPKDPKRFVTLAKACLTCEAYDALETIQCPVLVIGGAQDKIVGGQAAAEIAEKLGCKLHVYDKLGHAAYEEAKDFNRRVYDFFTEP